MALSKSSLEARFIAEMEALGATAEGEHSWVPKLAKALANAVVDEMTKNGKASVGGGSSQGDWPIK